MRVSDIMDSAPPRLQEKTALREATEIIINAERESCPVVSEDDELLGELTLSKIIELGMPDYIDLLEDVTFVECLEPFENFFRQEEQLLVEQVFSDTVLTIEPEELIVEASHRLISENTNHIYVVKEQKLQGIVTVSSIVSKIFLL